MSISWILEMYTVIFFPYFYFPSSKVDEVRYGMIFACAYYDKYSCGENK